MFARRQNIFRIKGFAKSTTDSKQALKPDRPNSSVYLYSEFATMTLGKHKTENFRSQSHFAEPQPPHYPQINVCKNASMHLDAHKLLLYIVLLT